MSRLLDALGIAVVIVLLALGISFLLSWPVYMLWNGCLVGAVDSVKEVTWLQAWGISILFHMLFKTTVNTEKKG